MCFQGHTRLRRLVAEYTREVPVAVMHGLLGVPEAERAPAAGVLDMWYRAKFQQPRDEAEPADVLGYVRKLVAYERTRSTGAAPRRSAAPWPSRSPSPPP